MKKKTKRMIYWGLGISIIILIIIGLSYFNIQESVISTTSIPTPIKSSGMGAVIG